MTRSRRVARDSWNVFIAVYGSDRGIIAFDEEAAVAPNGYRDERRVLATFGGWPGEAALPSQRASVRLGVLEDAMVAALEAARVDAWLVGRVTTTGSRIFVFEVADGAAFDRAIGPCVASFADLAPKVACSPAWEFFLANVQPAFVDRMQIANQQVIDRLLEADSVASVSHVLEHQFGGPPAALVELARVLGSRGYRCSGAAGPLIAFSTSPLDAVEVTETTCELHELATASGAQYAGWGAGVRAV